MKLLIHGILLWKDKGGPSGLVAKRKDELKLSCLDNLIVGQMRDRHLFSIFCYENFAHLPHLPYILSGEWLFFIQIIILHKLLSYWIILFGYISQITQLVRCQFSSWSNFPHIANDLPWLQPWNVSTGASCWDGSAHSWHLKKHLASIIKIWLLFKLL